MGAVFAIPYARLQSWPADLHTEVRAAGFHLLALTPAPDAVDLTAFRPPPRLALLLGAEGSGLTPRAQAAATTRARIPMSHAIDSLNVGAAAAIAFYATHPRGAGTGS
jgi:tRNA G18 (ribose-2'-O)-methylase SpoU